MKISELLALAISAANQADDVQMTDYDSKVVINNRDRELYPFEIEKCQIEHLGGEWLFVIYPGKTVYESK